MTINYTAGEPSKLPAYACTVSVVVPVFNEENVLPEFQRRLSAALVTAGVSWEVLYIDDGSSDSTPKILKEFQIADNTVSVVRLSRNFGKEAAMASGLRLARGEVIVLIDADLQDPPELIPDMLLAWREGFDVVNMRRRTREGETWLKKSTAHWFYRIINRLSEVQIPADVGDFRLLSRRAVDALNQLVERNRFTKGMFAWIGYSQTTLAYDRQPRFAGYTKWRYRKLWHFALEGITGFSLAPLKLATYAGLLSALAAFSYALIFLIKTLVVTEPVHGFPTLFITILLLGGLQLMSIGIVGEYLGRLFIEAKQRPLYLIDYYKPAMPVAEKMADEVNT